MRIHFKRESTGPMYFPGLARPLTVDTDTLASPEARQVEELVRAAAFFDLPAAPPAQPPSYEPSRYAVTIEHDGHDHTALLDERTAAPPVQALLAYLEGKANAAR